MKAAFFSAVAAVMVLAAGCGPAYSGDAKCESVCASYNACPDPTDTKASRADKYECSYYCGDVVQQQARAKAAGNDAGQCLTEWNAYLDCWTTNKAEICNPATTVCTAAGTAYKTCVKNNYCATNKTDVMCTAAGAQQVRTF